LYSFLSVAVAKSGYAISGSPKTATIYYSGGNGPPEEWSVQDRWSKWVDPASIATLDYSVNSNGVCTVIVGGAADSIGWNASILYSYTANANTCYEYKLEAWTQSGERNVWFQFYGNSDDDFYLGKSITLNSEPKTYTVQGQRIPKDGVQALHFQCANQTGVFNVRIRSITEYTPEPAVYELTEDGTSYRLVSDMGASGAVTIPATYNGKPVTEIQPFAFSGAMVAAIKFFWCTLVTGYTRYGVYYE